MKTRIILSVLIALLCSISLKAAEKSEYPKEHTKSGISYMGNIEAGHIFPWAHFMKGTSGFVTLTTTHGVRITPYLFTGLGVGAWLGYYSGGCTMLIPYYADVRLTLPKKHFRPFFDLKAGRLSNNTFIGPSIGCKYAWGSKGGIYLSFGTNFITNEYHSGWDGLNLRLGFDF
ncbi:MAG: hypothetical protein NC411_09765 [Bacteroides sp.]|nr:hypothetical protein [Bacteroides sp.]